LQFTIGVTGADRPTDLTGI